VTVQGQKASDLRATAAFDLSRIAGPETYDAFKALADKEKDAEGAFGMALDRMMVAKECGTDIACYGKKLNDPQWTRAEKAAFSIGFSGDAAKGVPLLLGALKPLASINQERFPVHMALLYALTRLAPKNCKECIDKLDKQIERDEKAVRIPGARDLLGETRVTEAIIQNRDESPMPAAAAGDEGAAAAADEKPAKGGKGKAGKNTGKKAGGKKKGKKK